MKLTDAQRSGLEELKDLKTGSARDGFMRKHTPDEGLWWMPRGYRSIAHGTIKALHSKGLIEMHSDQYNRYDWCRINAAGIAALAVTRPASNSEAK